MRDILLLLISQLNAALLECIKIAVLCCTDIIDMTNPHINSVDLWKSYNIWTKDVRPSNADHHLKSTSFRLKVSEENPMGDLHPCVRLLVIPEEDHLVVDLMSALKALKAYDVTDVDYHPLFRAILKVADDNPPAHPGIENRRPIAPISIFRNPGESYKALQRWMVPGTQTFSPPDDKLTAFFFALLQTVEDLYNSVDRIIERPNFRGHVSFEPVSSEEIELNFSICALTFSEMLLAFNRSRVDSSFEKNAYKRRYGFQCKFGTNLDLESPIGISLEKMKTFSHILSANPIIGQILTEILLELRTKSIFGHYLKMLEGYKLSTFKLVEEFAMVNPYTEAHLYLPVEEELALFMPKMIEYSAMPEDVRPFCVIRGQFEPEIDKFPHLVYAAKMHAVEKARLRNLRSTMGGLKTKVPDCSDVIRARVKRVTDVVNEYAAAERRKWMAEIDEEFRELEERMRRRRQV